RAGTDAHYLWMNADWNNFLSKWQQLSQQGLRLTRFKQYNIGGNWRYAGIWWQGVDDYYLWVNPSWDTFVSKRQQLASQNLRHRRNRGRAEPCAGHGCHEWRTRLRPAFGRGGCRCG